MARVLAIRQPARLGGQRRSLVTDKQATRRKREDQVDRPGLANALNARMAELPITQTELANKTGVSPATLRMMQASEGTRHYSSPILSAVSLGLNWPADRLQRIFYRMPEQDPVTPSGVELVTQAMMTQLEPYLKKIDAMDKRLSVVMEAIHRVNARIDAVLGVGDHSAEDD